MATSFFITPKPEATGFTTLFVRLQSRKLKINYKMTTNLEVEIAPWQKVEKDLKAMKKFREKEPAM